VAEKLDLFPAVCRVHCSVCEGLDHHWDFYGDEDADGEPVMGCKHCDQTRPAEDDDYD
jgi:hypothetical protein